MSPCYENGAYYRRLQREIPPHLRDEYRGPRSVWHAKFAMDKYAERAKGTVVSACYAIIDEMKVVPDLSASDFSAAVDSLVPLGDLLRMAGFQPDVEDGIVKHLLDTFRSHTNFHVQEVLLKTRLLVAAPLTTLPSLTLSPPKTQIGRAHV